MKLDPISSAYQTFNKAIDRVLAYPAGPERWRACVDLWLTLHPQNKAIYKSLCAENANIRAELNKFGFSKDKENKKGLTSQNLRSCLALPHTLLYLIERSDPEAFKAKKNAPKMFKTLSEFTTREVY